jgi:signal transduction histidine kinase
MLPLLDTGCNTRPMAGPSGNVARVESVFVVQGRRRRGCCEPGKPGTLGVVAAVGVAVGANGNAGTGRPAAARPGVELAVVWAFLGIRGFVLVQAAVAVAAGSLSRSSSPPLDAALLSAVAGESLLLGRWLIQRRSVLPLRWPVAADFALSVLVLALAPVYLSAAGRIDSWTIWAYPVTLSTTLLVGAALDRLLRVLAVSGALGASYAVAVAVPLAGNAALRMTAVVNALSFLGLAMVAFVISRFMRGLGDAADAARQRVAELEQDRSRALIHDLLVYLRLDKFAEADDRTRAVMITQAQAKHQQMRSYVDGTGGAQSLAAVVDGVLALHPGLSVRTQIETGPDVRLPDDAMQQLERALDTALANVEQHARGAGVVVSVQPEPGHVAVTVCDDGPGFDPASVRQGFGISEVLGRQLAGVGGTGAVESRPGAGTVVRITIPAERP